MSAPFRFPKFFVTNPSPCPYLPGKVERKVFTELNGRHASELNEALGRIGFRRSQSVAYRPSCIDCSACVSVRVLAAEFEASATQRKLLRRHADLEVSACKPWTTEEQYQLLRRYLAHRHPGRRNGRDGRERFRRHGRADAGPHLRHRISRAVGRRAARAAGRRLPSATSRATACA